MRGLKHAVVACLLAAAFLFPAAAAELAAQKKSDRGVTVVVTPQNLSVDAKTWDFKIVLDTHSQDLTDDLTKSAVLLDETGARHAPVGWEGAGPGGHHREGTLKFEPVTPAGDAIELRITRAGEATPRSFRWRLK
jgi:hypothetical protein